MIPDIVPGSEVNTPQAAPHMDAAPLRNAYLSIGQSQAQGAGAVGDFFSEVGQKFQENQNARTLLNADLQMRQYSDQYRDSLAKNPDESSWVPGFKDGSEDLKQSLLSGPGVGPDVKRQMQANLDRWQSAQQNEITTAAQMKALSQTKETVISNYNYALHQGDQQGAENAIKMGEQSHAIFPADAARMRLQAPGIIQKAQADLLIENDPQAAYQQLKDKDEDGEPTAFKNLDPATRLRLTTQAAWKWHSSQSQAADSIREDIDSGATNQEQVISKQEEAGQISAKGASALRHYIRQKNWAESKASAGEIMSDASSYDPTADKDGSQYRDIADSSAALPDKYRKQITHMLQTRIKDSDKSDDGMKTINEMYEARTFGDWEKTDADGKKTRDPVGWKNANETRWNLQQQLNTFRQNNPQATHSDERGFIMKAAQKHFDQQSTQAVIDGFSGSSK